MSKGRFITTSPLSKLRRSNSFFSIIILEVMFRGDYVTMWIILVITIFFTIFMFENILFLFFCQNDTSVFFCNLSWKRSSYIYVYMCVLIINVFLFWIFLLNYSHIVTFCKRYLWILMVYLFDRKSMLCSVLKPDSDLRLNQKLTYYAF